MECEPNSLLISYTCDLQKVLLAAAKGKVPQDRWFYDKYTTDGAFRRKITYAGGIPRKWVAEVEVRPWCLLE